MRIISEPVCLLLHDTMSVIFNSKDVIFCAVIINSKFILIT
jgi:hypothetical protein